VEFTSIPATYTHLQTRTLSGQELNTVNSDLEFTSGSWKDTTAVNRIDISLSSSTLAEYTHIALYGIKGA
jgi:hypothetical protein